MSPGKSRVDWLPDSLYSKEFTEVQILVLNVDKSFKHNMNYRIRTWISVVMRYFADALSLWPPEANFHLLLQHLWI